MSDVDLNALSRATGSGSAAARTPITYNLAALRLAQANNRDPREPSRGPGNYNVTQTMTTSSGMLATAAMGGDSRNDLPLSVLLADRSAAVAEPARHTEAPAAAPTEDSTLFNRGVDLQSRAQVGVPRMPLTVSPKADSTLRVNASVLSQTFTETSLPSFPVSASGGTGVQPMPGMQSWGALRGSAATKHAPVPPPPQACEAVAPVHVDAAETWQVRPSASSPAAFESATPSVRPLQNSAVFNIPLPNSAQARRADCAQPGAAAAALAPSSRQVPYSNAPQHPRGGLFAPEMRVPPSPNQSATPQDPTVPIPQRFSQGSTEPLPPQSFAAPPSGLRVPCPRSQLIANSQNGAASHAKPTHPIKDSPWGAQPAQPTQCFVPPGHHPLSASPQPQRIPHLAAAPPMQRPPYSTSPTLAGNTSSDSQVQLAPRSMGSQARVPTGPPMAVHASPATATVSRGTATPPNSLTPAAAAPPPPWQSGDLRQALEKMGIRAHVAPVSESAKTSALPTTVAPTAASNFPVQGNDSPISKLQQLLQPQQPPPQQPPQQRQPPSAMAASRHSRVPAPTFPHTSSFPQVRYEGTVPPGNLRRQFAPPRGSHSSLPPPPAPPNYGVATPPAALAAPDPAVVKRFRDEYAQQEETDGVGDELRAQLLEKAGTIGTLDEQHCLSLIECNDVTFVVTDTGTGKSTRIPIALHKAHPEALIVNAQPRRTAAINLAQRVAEILGATLGKEVGYSVRGEHIGDVGETNIMYVTTYSLFIYFLWHEFKEKLPFSYIIVDEFHERTPDVEVILLMLKLWLRKHPGAFKLVLCSATAQVEEWKSFFGGFTVGIYARSPVMYPVREYFMEDLHGLIGIRTAPMIPQRSGNMVASEQMHQLILVCKQLLEYLAKHTATQDSALVFMPGRTQVELMATWIRDNLEESLEPIAWYRDVELSLIQGALARPAVTRKKVYIATDIAEVSVTLPDVVFVIDSGTGKRPQVSEKEKTSYAFPPLRLLWETTSNAQQRRGRVGRVQQGFYFSLLSKSHYESLRGSENRIRNAVITELVLHSLLITQKPFAFFQLCNEKPDRGALAYSLHLLQDGGHIIRKDDPLADVERVALDRQRSAHVMDSPWNALIEEALAAAAAAAPSACSPVSPSDDQGKNAPRQRSTPNASSNVVQAHDNEGGGRKESEEEDHDAEEDSSDVAIPEMEAEAFQQCYYMTLRGVIAARSPVSVSAATNVFFGMLYGTATLSMLAAAIESSKSPFHVPYTINDRMERVAMVRQVSSLMQRYHGSLQSDLICSMEVILEYMSMQRDGLSEEAQEEWCQERSISRTRVVDTLNLFTQMKEQVSSVLPFSDVTDIDALTAQFHQNAELLVLMLVASHTELAIEVQLDGRVAQSKGFVGHGMFFPLKCLKDESVPTVCPWDRTKISVPLSLQTIQRKVLAVFASQVEPDLFVLVLLVFSFKLLYAIKDSGATHPSYLLAVSHSGVRRTFQCDTLTAQQVLQLRRIQCAQLRCMQLQVEERVKAGESERLSAALRSARSDFGLPESAMKTPYLIPTVLQHALKLLVIRLKGSPSYRAQKRSITDFPPGTPFCKLVRGAELQPPILQSVLVHSSNGLSMFQSADGVASPTAAPSPATPATADLSEHSGAAEERGEVSKAPEASRESEEEEDDDSDVSSDSGVHVPTFSYDV